ncbi:MAG: LysR family transcriptional regulator [Pseudomonadota bacterium]
MGSFDLNLLIVFDAVMSERNLRKAGERLGRSQPSISQAVARLRDTTGDQLFERTATGVKPTARAEVLWSDIRDPLATLRRVIVRTEFSPNNLTGESVFGLSDDARILFWPKLARTIIASAPKLTLRALDTNHTSVWNDLGSGKIDLAISVAGQPPPGFGSRILMQDEFCLLLSKESSSPKTPEDYASRNHLAVVFTDEQPAYADEALQAEGMGRHVVARVSRFDALPELVKELDAVVALPKPIANYFAQTHGLNSAPLPVPFPPAILKLCWHEKNRNDPHNRWLRDTVIDIISTPGNSG